MTSPSPPVFDHGAISDATKTRFMAFPEAVAGGTDSFSGGFDSLARGGEGEDGDDEEEEEGADEEEREEGPERAGIAEGFREGGAASLRGLGAGGATTTAAAGAVGAAAEGAVFLLCGGGVEGDAGADAFDADDAGVEEEATGTGSFPPVRSQALPWTSWSVLISSLWSFLRSSI